MAIIQQDGFDFFDDIKRNPDFLIIKAENLQVQIDYIKAKKIKSIALTYFEIGAIYNLNFLEEINFIERIMINDVDIDFSGLYNLKNLKYAILSVQNRKQYLDYSQFSQLKYLSIDWYSKFPSLKENKKLKELIIRKYKSKEMNFKDLDLPDCLENLEVIQSNIRNLESLSVPSLKKIEVHYCRNLNTLNGIESTSDTLESLIVCNCRNLTEYDKLSTCLCLKKIILGDCGDIPSLNWLTKLKKIEHFSFWGTQLTDKDTSPCFGIDYVSFKNSKHYTHKLEEFNK